jgi:MarR family transcriptional regulator, organic hydroperoxide resistance regulator
MPKRLPALFGSPDASPGWLLWQASNAWQRRQRDALRTLGLSYVQFLLLSGVVWLAEREEGPVTQVRLARHTRTDAMMTSQVVRALQARKLLRRVPHTADSRALTLAPTAAGRRLARQAIHIVHATDQDFFGDSGPRLGDALKGLLA